MEAASPMEPPRRKQLAIVRASTPTGGGSGGGDAGSAASLTQDQLEQVGFLSELRGVGWALVTPVHGCRGNVCRDGNNLSY